MNKVALFDFCETIANFQTADEYVWHVINSLNDKKLNYRLFVYKLCLKSHIIGVLERLRPNAAVNKRLILRLIKGVDENLLDELAHSYYEEKIKPNLIKDVIKFLQEKKKENFDIYIVSAGYDIYIKYFIEDFNIPAKNLIVNRIHFSRGLCTGTYSKPDLLFSKVEVLESIFEKKKNYFVAISDSKTDIPMLKWADEGVVVSRDKAQKWAIDNNFKEIIWI